MEMIGDSGVIQNGIRMTATSSQLKSKCFAEESLKR